MRSLLLLIILCTASSLVAQGDASVELNTLPPWMQTLVTGKKAAKYTKPSAKPLHTNAFIGTWTVQLPSKRRLEYWGDAHRMLFQEFADGPTPKRATYVDLAANVRMNVSWYGQGAAIVVEDLYIPQAGYFREIWNDTVVATGRTDTVMGQRCKEVQGIDGNKDSSTYWQTDVEPALFADMGVWSSWLCREGELKFLSALSSTKAGPALRADWTKRTYGPEAGSIRFTSITPGKQAMPAWDLMPNRTAERRFAWINNSGTGRLPAWMRSYLGGLPPDSLPLAYTPAPIDRGIPDNVFIGTLTAETPTTYIGAHKDTTIRLAKYSYWADARRAVLQLEDPDDEGYLFYAVDLDADVVMASHNEGHSYVIPKLAIASLEEVGLKEFGRGLELDFTPRGQYRKILGRTCELYTTSERFVQYFMIPTDSVVNPVFDMKNWMTQRISQKFKDLMFFGLADKPMPMAVMGTHLTSYKPGKAKPPVVDLSNYSVRDERLRQKRREERENDVPEIQVRDIRDGGEMRGSDMVPDMIMADAPMAVPEPPMPSDAGSGTGDGGGSGPGRGKAALPPELKALMQATTNRFIGTAKLQYTITSGDRTSTWTVRYASDSTRMVIIGQEDKPLPSEHQRAYTIDRKAGTETIYTLLADSSVVQRTGQLERRYASVFPVAYADSLLTGSRKLLGRSTEHRSYEIPTTRRESWVDTKTPSLFHDVLGARKSWGGVEVLLRGPMITSTGEGMPMEVQYEYHGGEQMTMRVLELNPGPVDPKVFEIGKDSWRR